MRSLILIAALLGAACQSAPVANVASAVSSQPIVLGRGYDIASALLGEVRHVNVYLPAGYTKGETRYPVLYLIDGGVD
jgi:enterochelin esterase-like enzyme